MSPGLSSCCSFPELSQISFLEPLASSLTPIRRPAPSASSPPPPPLTPLLLAAPPCWMCLLFLQLLLCPRSFPTQASTCTYTHIHTLAYSYMYLHKHAHTCPSYHPPSLSLHVRKTGKPLWYSLSGSGSDLPLQTLEILFGFPLQFRPQLPLNISLGKCLFNISLSPGGHRPSALLTKHIARRVMVHGSHWIILGRKKLLYYFKDGDIDPSMNQQSPGLSFLSPRRWQTIHSHLLWTFSNAHTEEQALPDPHVATIRRQLLLIFCSSCFICPSFPLWLVGWLVGWFSYNISKQTPNIMHLPINISMCIANK